MKFSSYWECSTFKLLLKSFFFFIFYLFIFCFIFGTNLLHIVLCICLKRYLICWRTDVKIWKSLKTFLVLFSQFIKEIEPNYIFKTQILLFRLNALNIIIEIKKLLTLMNFLSSLAIVTFCVRPSRPSVTFL